MSLFQHPDFPAVKVRHDAPQTSVQAALTHLPKSGTARRKVLDYIVSRGTYGATDDEIAKGLDMNPSTVRPRRLELQEVGLIVENGLTRKTRWGNDAKIWVDTD